MTIDHQQIGHTGHDVMVSSPTSKFTLRRTVVKHSAFASAFIVLNVMFDAWNVAQQLRVIDGFSFRAPLAN